jgi:L-iditol 2-dehydrogenase
MLLYKTSKMKAAVLHRPLQIVIEDIPMPSFGPDEVLIKVKSVGICGSDFHYWKTGRIGSFVVKEPLILGHELSGEVVEAGKNVSNLSSGDRVVVEPGFPCRKCRFCKSGRYNLCPEERFMGTPPMNGAFAEYVAAPSDFVFKMPEGLSFDEGALVEPLAVGVYAIKRAGVVPGDVIAILGAGPVGLLTLVAAMAAGASEVYVSDIDDWRLEKAKALGATITINVKNEDLISKVKELTEGNYVDITIDASGSPEAAVQAVKITRNGGTIVLVGMYEKAELVYPLIDVVTKELNVKGILRYANVFPRSLKILASRRFNVKSLISHHLPLDEVEKGFKLMDKKWEPVLKIMVHP